MARKTASVSKPVNPGSASYDRKVRRGYDAYLGIVREFPATEESTSYGTPAIKVKGKLLSRWRTEAEGGMALRCDSLDREILLQTDPESFFLTDHYAGYPWILVRLDRISAASLTEVVRRGWRLVAPPKLVRLYDAATIASASISTR